MCACSSADGISFQIFSTCIWFDLWIRVLQTLRTDGHLLGSSSQGGGGGRSLRAELSPEDWEEPPVSDQEEPPAAGAARALGLGFSEAGLEQSTELLEQTVPARSLVTAKSRVLC